jgi:hypothetical protein
MAAKWRPNGGHPAGNPRLVEKKKKEDNLLSERGLFSLCFSLILDEGGLWEGWADFPYSWLAAAAAPEEEIASMTRTGYRWYML